MTIAKFIEQDVCSLICSSRPLPFSLTLPEMARHYRVSITPVRTAMRTLIRKKIVLRQPNGRMAANAHAKSTPADAAPAAFPDGGQDWQKTLTRDLICQSLRGETVFLREEAMALLYKVGRTPMRQCFQRLAGTGLLEHVPRRGWRVRPFRDEEMAAYLEIRELLELKALDLAQPHLVRADLERFLHGNASGRQGSPANLDNSFHRYLIGKSGNRFIQDFFDRHGAYFTTLFDYAALGASVENEMAAQHRHILKALLAQDWAAARRELSLHIQAQRPVLKKMLKRLDKSTVTLASVKPKPFLEGTQTCK